MYQYPVRTQSLPQRLTPEDELRLFRNLVRSLTCDAMKALYDLGSRCSTPEQAEGCVLMEHYLDFMKRLCENRA